MLINYLRCIFQFENFRFASKLLEYVQVLSKLLFSFVRQANRKEAKLFFDFFYDKGINFIDIEAKQIVKRYITILSINIW